MTARTLNIRRGVHPDSGEYEIRPYKGFRAYIRPLQENGQDLVSMIMSFMINNQANLVGQLDKVYQG